MLEQCNNNVRPSQVERSSSHDSKSIALAVSIASMPAGNKPTTQRGTPLKEHGVLVAQQGRIRTGIPSPGRAISGEIPDLSKRQEAHKGRACALGACPVGSECRDAFLRSGPQHMVACGEVVIKESG